MNKKEEVLAAAFREALTMVNPGDSDDQRKLEVIVTGMHAYSDREKQELTVDEMREYAAQGLQKIKEAGDDFSFNDWAMPR